MALTSTLGSPGIEIREIDNSIRIDSSTATTVFVPGFAAQGPVEEVISIGSMDDFELIYGKPTNGAERYFYYTVKALIDKGGSGCRVLTSRLPYGEGLGDAVSDAYTLLAYPAVPVIKKEHKDTDTQKTFTVDSDCFLFEKTLPEVISIEKKKVVDGEETDETDEKIAADAVASTYDIFIEEDFLNENVNDISTASFTFGIASEANFPAMTDNNGTFPNITVICEETKTEGSTTTKEEKFKAVCEGQISTEFANGFLYVNLSGSLHLPTSTDTEKKVYIGNILMRLAFRQASTNKLTNATYNTYRFFGNTANIKFYDAYEIAVSYDGQSEAQLGKLADVYTTPTDTNIENYVSDTNKYSKDVTYLLGAPATFQVSLKDYYNIITGEFINWSRRPYYFGTETGDNEKLAYESDKDKTGSKVNFGLIEALGHSAFIAINTSRTTVNENFEGYYLGMTDNTFSTPSDDYIFDALTGVKISTSTFVTKNIGAGTDIGLIDKVDGTGDFTTLGEQRLTFKTTGNAQGTLSRVITRDITSKEISGTDFDDTISMALFKLSKTTDNNDVLKLNYSLREKYNWSFSKNRLKSTANSSKPVSYYALNVMENSNNIAMMFNPYISEKDFMSFDGVFHGKMRVFGQKLVQRLDDFEDKYLRRVYKNIANNDETGNKNSHKIAKHNILSYKAMIAQAGVSPYLIRTNFISHILDNTEGKAAYENFTPMNSIYPFGAYAATSSTRKVIGQVPSKLARALQLVENDEEYPDIDLLVEGGLGTIFMNSNGHEMSGEFASRTIIEAEQDPDPTNPEGKKVELGFDETVILTGVEDMRTSRSSLSEDAEEVISSYQAVTDTFLQFANSMQNGGRGDTFYISDVPRGILIKGKDTKITNLYGVEIENNAYDFGESVVHSFPTSVYYPIKHQFDNIVSTYCSVYAQWVKIYDDFTGDKLWLPVSGHIAANMASTDAVYGPWYASAGLRRGVISGVLDYAISPTTSQRTDLYKICVNSVPKIPNYGVTIWGIRTMGKKDSAFDQNTCRRTFLYMEKKIKQLLRYYLFEPNTSFTRLQIHNDIDPFLEGIKNRGGIYSYTLVTDTTVNTPEIINNGDLVVAIAAAPTRTAENIIVEFTANKYTEEVNSSETLS